MSEQRRELFERIYGILNEHDPQRVDEVFTEDVVFEDDAWPTIMHGRDEVRSFLTAIWRAAPDFNFELIEGPYASPDGRHAAARIKVSGTFTGSYDPPGLAPTNGVVSTEFGAFYEFEGGQIKRERVILNMYDMGVQHGALPERGTLGERLAVAFQHLNAWRIRRRAARSADHPDARVPLS